MPISVLVCVLLGLAVATGVSLSGQTTSPQLRRVVVGAGAHQTRVQPESSFQLPTTNALLADSEPVLPPRPTRSSFMATWTAVSGAKGYLLDVSTNSAFDKYVNGYHDLDVGNATGRVVTGLNRGTTYYYRVRPYGLRTTTGYTATVAITTEATTGLTIHATFDTSITGNANAAAIEATINQAIAIYESLFTDPITIQIRFRYATSSPSGGSLDTFVEGLTVVYDILGSTWISALRADSKSSNDSIAMASVGSTGFTNLVETSANGRALGQNSPPAMNADGTISVGAPYDGIVTLNSATSFQFSRPTDANRFDAQRSVEKGIGSVMGLVYSITDFTPIDIFSWSAPGQRNSNYTATPRYFSIDGGVTNIVNFNNSINGTYADWRSPDCPQGTPYVQNAVPCTGQSSDVSATSPEGIALDVIGYDTAQAQTGPPRLGNISTRSFVQTGDNVEIGGFIVQGTGPKRVIIRAIGPELTQFGITNALANPTLELHDGTGAVIATNDDWQTTILGGVITTSQVTDIQNSGHAPTAASESAIIADLPPGNYTAIVRGVNASTGVALVEVYDLAPTATSNLGNISTRSFVQTGDNVMIGGFIVQGTGPKRVIIRAIGPELTQFGITDPLVNPTLELHNASGAVIATNDDWQTTILGGIITGSQVADIQGSGHAPTAASESAIVATLSPGNYTAIVRGVSSTTGVALVEVYNLN